MPITLQGTAQRFEPDFLRQLPQLERTMTAHGLDPSDVVIAKEPAATANVPFLGPFFYDYTVFLGDESFTVTEPSDARFLEYFYNRLRAADAPESSAPPQSDGMLARLSRWMMRPI
jgi:hypothetical protein